MPPFRITVSHPDSDHKDSTPAQIAGLFDDLEDVEEFIQSADDADRTELERVNVSLPVEQRVRKRDHEHLAELQNLGYEYSVEELVVDEWGTDDGDQRVPVTHRWEDTNDNAPASAPASAPDEDLS